MYSKNDKFSNLEKRICKLENLIRNKFESVQISEFDCDNLIKMIKRQCAGLPDFDVDYADDNINNGFINIGVYNPEYITSYDVEAVDYNKYDVSVDDSFIGTAISIKDVASIIANNFKNIFV
jgi:hypothetical protein